MLSTTGNSLNTNNSTNTSNNTNTNTSGNKSNLLSASSLINSDFMLPINNLTNNNNPMATTSSYLNDYKLYRDVGLFQQAAASHQQQASKQQQTANLIGNNTLNNLVVNNLTSSLNNLGNHTNLNGLPNHNQQLNNLNNLQQQQSATSVSTSKQQLINNNNPDFMIYLNRCNQFLELNMFQQALDEINHALSLVNNSTMARFRKAQALLGLKRYFECEKELWTCINLEPNVMDYRKELLKVKQIALMSLNLNHLDQNTILMAAQKYDSIKEAMDALMWNSMMDFNYSTGNTSTGPFQSSVATSNTTNTNNLNETSLMNGWSMHSNQAANRFGSTNSTSNQFNQLMNNGNNLLFNNNLISNNLLLNNTNLINRNNNGNTSNLTNSLTTNSSQHQQGHNNTSGLTSVSMGNNLKTVANQQIVAPTSASNNLINSSTSSNSSSSNNQQQPSNSPLNNSDQNLLTNGLNGLSNGNNRFNYLLRTLDHQSHLLNSNSAAQSTNGQNNSNQNLINNQQVFNRMMPSFIDNNNVSNALDQHQQQTKNHGTSAAVNNHAVLNCSRNLSSKLNLNDNSILNGSNGLLMMNNNNSMSNNAPSPICAKLSSTGSNQPTSAANNNNASNLNSANSTSLANSCNYNIFNQMPEMKLIETIVPNLLGSLGAGNSSSLNSSSTHSNHNTDSTLNNSNNNDLTSTNHKLLASLAKEVNSVKDSLVNNLVDNFTNNVQHHQSTKQQSESSYEDCNKSANKKSMGKIDILSELAGVVDKSMMINKLDNSGVLDFKSVKEDSLINSLNQQHLKTTNDDNQSLASSIANNSCGSTTSSVTNASTANHLTSYSDIVKRAKKITQQSLTNSNASTGGQTNLGCLTSNKENTNLTNKTDNESNSDDSSAASKRPTNLWAYNGLRVANVSLTASKSSLMSLFSKFGRIRLLERIINKTTTNNIWVYYDNPVAPVDAVTKLQNVFIENICVDSESPLRLFFAPTDDQKDLKFSRPKQPPDNKGECYYWRTTNCFSKDQCPLLHLPANKNIDAQIWMRLLKENPEKESDNETASATNQSNADNSTESASEL